MKNIKDFSANNGLEFYQSDRFILKVIECLEAETEKIFFEPLELLNLFWKQKDLICADSDNAESIINTLESLPLTEKQRQLLAELIYKYLTDLLSMEFYEESHDKIELRKDNLYSMKKKFLKGKEILTFNEDENRFIFKIKENYLYASNTEWANGRYGKFVYNETNNCYKFDECQLVNGKWKRSQFDSKHLPVFAKGFISFLVHNFENTEIIKTLTDYYDKYYVPLAQKYIQKEQIKLGSDTRNLDAEFYEIHLKEEKINIEQSQELLSCIPQPAKNLINGHVENYFKHIRKFNGNNVLKENTCIETPAVPLSQNEHALTPDVKKFIKEQILPIWKSNVEENTLDDALLKAIATADFSVYYKKGQKQKVGHFIFALKKIMGIEWADNVLSKLNDKKASLSYFQKKQPVVDLKNVMKGIKIVNNAGGQFKVDIKTQYTDKTTNKPYWKATK